MSDLEIRRDGKAGRITLQRPSALNALTHPMCLMIDSALEQWRSDDDVQLVIIDAEGERAFCAGGDISQMYRAGTRGDYSYGHAYWQDEYRLNARIASWPKPVMTLMQGYTMGGGVGLGCHASHRIICDSSRIAMPECSIGLVPDVGGSWLLARSPGRTGECLALTGLRMKPGDAVHCGFADCFCPRDNWPELAEVLCKTGDIDQLEQFTCKPPASRLEGLQDVIDCNFSPGTLAGIISKLKSSDTEFARECLDLIGCNSPLSMHCALDLVRRQRSTNELRQALELEFRFVCRAAEHGDFIEGIRARIIDRGSTPDWKHKHLLDVEKEEIEAMLAPLDDVELNWSN